MNNRVAITGMGAVSGLGHNLIENWKNLIEGKSGISLMTSPSLDIEKCPIKIGGEVKNFVVSSALLDQREQPRYAKFIHFALQAAHEALSQSKILEKRPYPDEKMGCILGIGMGGIPMIEESYKVFLEKGPRRISPFFIPGIIPNMAPGLISLNYGLKGSSFNISSACASGNHAIFTSCLEIQSGRADVIVSGGAESVLSNLPVNGFVNMKALSKNSDPLTASRPFDRQRDGFIIGEGAGVLILENLDKAVERGATILAEIIGFGNSSDCHHITAPHPEGEGAAACMEQAIYVAKINPKDVGYINAHGTSTPLGDIAETMAIKKVFKTHAYNLKVSSTKSMTGHLLGAAGGIETIFTAMALFEQKIPPTINLDTPDPLCDLDYVANKCQSVPFNYALNNSFGFGGTNSCLILKKY